MSAEPHKQRRLAPRPLFLGVLSFFLLFVSMLHGKSWSLWRLPFVLGLFPATLLKFALFRLAALVAALAAIVTGCIAIKKRSGTVGGVFGALAGCLTVGLIGYLAFTYFSTIRDDIDMTICGRNLREVSRGVLWGYAGSTRGLYPPLSSQPGVLMFSPETIPPTERLGRYLVCPTMRKAKQPTTGPASPFDDQSYFYLGYVVLNDDDVEAFAQAYRKQIAEGGNFDGDLTVETPNGTKVLRRLRSGVDGDSENVTPVLIERDFGHVKIETVEGRKVRVHGARVVYMNGSVKLVPRGTWPMTKKTQRILAELAR